MGVRPANPPDPTVLFVSVSVVALPIKVSVDVGSVSTPVLEIDEMTGAVSVLLVSVSVVALPTKVSVAAGRVRTPEAIADGFICVVPEVDPDMDIIPVTSSTDVLLPLPRKTTPDPFPEINVFIYGAVALIKK